MRKSHGKMSRRSRKMRKHHKNKGMQPVTKYLQEFDAGATVCVKIVSSEAAGMPHPRFHGRTGKVLSRQGGAYKIEVNDKGKDKTIIVNPVHLTQM